MVTGWPGCDGVAWWRRCDVRMKRNGSPDAQIWVFGPGVGDCGSSFINTVSVASVSSANSYHWPAHCVTPRLIRIHAESCNGDDTSMSMHKRP